VTLSFGDLTSGLRLPGVVAESDVTVVAVEMHGASSAILTYRTSEGRLGERIILEDDLAGLVEVSERRWSFDADGAMFRLASEAHRIGQRRPCHLWNLVAHETREGKVFERLFAKIEEQRGVYGDQVYDVLGDAQINMSLRELLMRAIARWCHAGSTTSRSTDTETPETPATSPTSTTHH